MDTVLGLWPIVVLLGVIVYGLTPLAARKAVGDDANPIYESVDPAKHRIPATVTGFIRNNVAALAAVGFTVAADLIRFRGTMATRLALLVNAKGEHATVVVMYTQQGGAGPMVEFTAALANGRMLDVNNSGSAPLFPPRSGHEVERFPDEHDPARLYRIFSALLRRRYGTPQLKHRDVAPDPGKFLRDITNEEYRAQVEAGYFRFDESTQQFRPTIKGAYLMTWKMLPPFGALRKRAVKRRAARLLSELRMHDRDERPVAPVTRVPVSEDEET